MAETDAPQSDFSDSPRGSTRSTAHETRGAPDLGSLLVESAQLPWYRSLARQCRPERPLPPLVVTSRPVAVKEIWGSDRRGRGLVSSSLLHVAAVVLLFTVLSNPHIEQVAGESIDLAVPVDISRFLTALEAGSGGGSGGLNSPLPVSRGKLPRFDERQITPVSLQPVEQAPLTAEPTLLGPRDIQITNLELEVFGDPLAAIGPPSHGPGTGGGIGTKEGTGIGPGNGPGYGPGSGGGFSGVYRIGGDISEPRLRHKVDPEYSETARKAKLQGTVVLLIEVWPDGRPHNIHVERGLGLGLDEQAVQAVEQWRFEPGKKGGQPVRVGARVQVSFRLL